VGQFQHESSVYFERKKGVSKYSHDLKNYNHFSNIINDQNQRKKQLCHIHFKVVEYLHDYHPETGWLESGVAWSQDCVYHLARDSGHYMTSQQKLMIIT